MSDEDRRKVNSLEASLEDYGSWTEGQVKFVNFLIDRAKAPKQEALDLDGSVNPMVAMINLFQAGKTKLKFPKVRIASPEGRNLVLSLAGEKSKYHGNVMVNDDDVYDQAPWGSSKRWYGAIDKDGVFRPSQKSDEDVVAALQEFSRDPIQAATAYGNLKGNCCFCNKPLTDPTSVTVGYGKICAGNYGLPWGVK
jgi:hypothetical protein